MPIYEYTCRNCGNKFDELRSMKEADFSIECNRCHSNKTVRSLSICFARDGQSGCKEAFPAASSCAGCHGGSCATCGH